ncbi:hypothetical protein GUJ93_ZPchr0008g12793 [Zizania palustris]|uniref:YDG domain-containing protein n=1 Tax=Zizania palustris TaxID=103762 RepID=A0A8J5RCU9_ZIZPA|nr:hypothetical protein GUJ93_ZPchr0008g12793 [Zizania palustris]
MDGEDLSEKLFRAAHPRVRPGSAANAERGSVLQRGRRPPELPRPPPRPASASDGRGKGSNGVRGCGEEGRHVGGGGGGGGGGANREAAAAAARNAEAAGRNAVAAAAASGLVGYGAERASRSVLSREKKGNGGGGTGDSGTKRRLERAAAPPLERSVALMKSSHASDENRVACEDNRAEGGARRGELHGKDEASVHKWRRKVSARRGSPPGHGRDDVTPLARKKGDKVVSNLKAMPVDVGLDVSQDVVAMDCGNNSVNHEVGRSQELSIGNFLHVKSSGNTLQHERRTYASPAAGHVKVMNRCKGSSPKVAAEPYAEGPSKEQLKGKRVRESDMKKSSMHAAARVLGRGTMRSPTTPTKAVQPPARANHKHPLHTLQLHRPFGPLNKLKLKGPAQSKHLLVKIIYTSELVGQDNLMDEGATKLEDDVLLKAISVHEGRVKLYVNYPSHGSQNADDRSKIRMFCRRFQFIHKTIVKSVKQPLKVRRVDLEADRIIKKLPDFTKPRPTVGNVSGVEVGDEFRYRVELAILGIHRPYQGGIDSHHNDGAFVAISIVASGVYPYELSSSGELIYTGSGGKPADKEGDQKLERGNLALYNCIATKTPVRVIHGFKRGKDSPSTFTYDGLYRVVDFWTKGQSGSMVFKYRLQRIPGQPKLPSHIVKFLRKSA